jgi:hypothetical protein
MRNRTLFVIAIVVLATSFIFWRQRRAASPEAAPPEAISTKTLASEVAHAPSAAPSHVRKMTRTDRDALAAQIRASLAHRAPANGAPATNAARPTATTAAPTLDEPLLTLEDVGPELKSALDEAIPILGECYEQHPEHTTAGSGSDAARVAVALMVMTSDPQLGTIVDADKLTDADGTPLDGALEGCLRDTIESLALPPLGKPGKLPLQYSFRFDDNDERVTRP